MIPAALFALLAISRLGAIHAVVFGGFAPASLAQRIEASKPRVVMTASCGIEGAKAPMNYKPLIEGAVKKSSFKPEKVIIWQREELRWDPVAKENGEKNWQKLVRSAKDRGIKADCVPVKSSDGVYIIYTSGKTPSSTLRRRGCPGLAKILWRWPAPLYEVESIYRILERGILGICADHHTGQAQPVYPKASSEKPVATQSVSTSPSNTSLAFTALAT